MDQDRLDMLKHISFINKKNLNLFKDYIPNHYDEIYTLFSLLRDAEIDYHDINFDKPKEKDNSFTFIFTTKKKYIKILTKFIENNSIVSYMRNKSFNIDMHLDEENDNYLLIFT